MQEVQEVQQALEYGMDQGEAYMPNAEYGMDQGETYMPNAAWKRGYQSGYQDAQPAETPDLTELLRVVNELTESLKKKE